MTTTKTRVLALLAAAPLSVVLAPALASAMPSAESKPLTSTSTDTPDGRPVLHVSDVTSMGSARHDALDQAYTDCLIEAGAPTIDADSVPRPVPNSNFSKDTGLILDWPAPAGPRAACADLDPVFPPVLEAATNPTFAAQAQEYVTCLRSSGLFVRLLNDENLDWTYRAGYDVPDNNAEIEDSCLLGTFGSD
jgi:hypothetical protein